MWSNAINQVYSFETRYAMALCKHKVPFELHIYPYGPHGLGTVDKLVNVDVTPRVKRAHKWICEVKEWLAMQWDY